MKGKYTRIDVDRVRAAPWSTTSLTKRGGEALKAALARWGQLVPLVVRQLAPDEYETIDGGYRLGLLSQLGHVAVDVLDLGSVDDATARELHLSLNLNHGKPGADVLADALESTVKAGKNERDRAIAEAQLIEQLPIPQRGVQQTVDKLRARGRPKKAKHNPKAAPGWVEFKVSVAPDAGRVIDDALSHVERHQSVKRPQALELICADFLAGAQRGGP